jgi:tetraacyldisaccharide-1-P 4'-kinase
MTLPSTAADFEILADSLSACADELHLRIMKAIRRNPPGGPAREPQHDPTTQAATIPINGNLEQGISHGAAQALFENEVALRQRANSLYVDAAVLAVAGLGAPQRVLLDLVAAARRRIRHASLLKDVIGITADMLGLAAAIAAGKPEHLPAVVESVKERYAQLKEDRAG